MSCEFSTSNEMYHYGVLDMRWGVRRDPSKAYSKSIRKKTKLETKSAKLGLKSAKKQMKSIKLEKKANRLDDDRLREKSKKLFYKANKLNLKSAKLRNKGAKWVKEMDKVFANYKVERTSDGSYRVTLIE